MTRLYAIIDLLIRFLRGDMWKKELNARAAVYLYGA